MGGFELQNYQCDGWQGKVYKINGSEPGYPNLKESTGYPDDILGLGGVNCRHRMFPFFPGISTPNPVKYDEEENKRIYEARQHQRKLERDMRLLKKKKACADVIGDTETSDMLKAKITAKSNELNNWCKANNLKRDYSRELVSEQLIKNNQKGFTPSTGNGNIDNNSKPLKLNVQLFAKKSSEYKTVELPKAEYGKVMHTIATDISKEQKQMKVFKKAIGNNIYTVENNGFGEYRIIGKCDIDEQYRQRIDKIIKDDI